MKESQLLGTLLPSSPIVQPIIQELREKYNLPEISPDDEPIKEIYLGDELISLEEFRQEIEKRVQNIAELLLPPLEANLYKVAKTQLGQPLNMQGTETLSDDWKKVIEAIYHMSQKMMSLFIQIDDTFFSPMTEMLYVYLLTGESQETSNDWISKVGTMTSPDGEQLVAAFASQISDPEVIVQQFRQEYKKTFGSYHPNVTKTMVSTAHYLRLKRMGKKWDYIVEEFIRLNKFSMPTDKNSKRYADTWRRHSQQLKKRIQRSEKVLGVLLRDKK